MLRRHSHDHLASFVRPLVSVLFVASAATAESGTHAPVVSTWDARASSISVAFRPGFLSGGHFDVASYYANFSATNGKLSSQFGIHYLNLRRRPDETIMHGGTATAAAVFSLPLASRYENGVPRLSLAPYVGIAPTFLVNGSESVISVPLTLGLGLPWSPSRSVTLTPWFEVSPGVNLDTRIHPATIKVADTGVTVKNGAVHLTAADVRRLVGQSVDFHVFFETGFRAGAEVALRAGPSVDLSLSGTLDTLGAAFRGKLYGWVGGSVLFRWDDVVPSVLPADARLDREACGDVEGRWLLCEAAKLPARRWPLVGSPGSAKRLGP